MCEGQSGLLVFSASGCAASHTLNLHETSFALQGHAAHGQSGLIVTLFLHSHGMVAPIREAQMAQVRPDAVRQAQSAEIRPCARLLADAFAPCPW